MKNFKFIINGNEYSVSIENIEDNVADVEVNGTHYKVELQKEIKMTKTPKLVRPVAVPTTDVAKTTPTGSTTPVQVSENDYNVMSPLPGVILEIKVKPGDVVSVGQRLMLIEAMKMENHIDADRAGKVKSINVNVGDNVMQGDVLLVIGE
ncbi:MAG TPA: acetyl-CoA carboxylase biotin carboxyl carrier protein subunit [Bacteroidia bacterium]|nr:acetyl-CoA carboxylase biotin carboxyl carrier protein subunit [Sphingobacteriales bacterium]HPD64635.1 acetyl-CoA carboxylase biotin carboxyl carrier protein subunit [Bacteroidia bacterium]HRS58483.1 acetyl-CoA carboxylase biotin carboxyl carrier protein subunit [Bacteroidia bacterium]HRU68386.1 acetyl-CoA carboxylase biotin carboxyl carrier protein subunit [Bacteroidia bacterium]